MIKYRCTPIFSPFIRTNFENESYSSKEDRIRKKQEKYTYIKNHNKVRKRNTYLRMLVQTLKRQWDVFLSTLWIDGCQQLSQALDLSKITINKRLVMLFFYKP